MNYFDLISSIVVTTFYYCILFSCMLSTNYPFNQHNYVWNEIKTFRFVYRKSVDVLLWKIPSGSFFIAVVSRLTGWLRLCTDFQASEEHSICDGRTKAPLRVALICSLAGEREAPGQSQNDHRFQLRFLPIRRLFCNLRTRHRERTGTRRAVR